MPMNTLWEAVRDFHRTFDQPAPLGPTMQSPDEVERRAKWIEEEVTELRDALALEDQVDAYLDIAYFALGGLVELGVRPQRLFEIVHSANMAKLHLVDGEYVPVKNETGKIIKPEGWEPPEPDLIAEIQSQITEYEE